jgi:PBP1b-binding outer membrane lipoprotein LpoB
MKKIFAILLVALFIFSIGCTSTEKDDDSDTLIDDSNDEDDLPSEIPSGTSVDTEQVDQAITDLESDLGEMNALINDSEVDIEDVIIDEELI